MSDQSLLLFSNYSIIKFNTPGHGMFINSSLIDSVIDCHGFVDRSLLSHQPIVYVRIANF